MLPKSPTNGVHFSNRLCVFKLNTQRPVAADDRTYNLPRQPLKQWQNCNYLNKTGNKRQTDDPFQLPTLKILLVIRLT